MAVLDFKEIPEANKASGHQDAFELFARDFLGMVGFTIVQGPARGADLGKDLIVEETRAGVVASTKVKWLVSCKHFAHSGASVCPDDERNILERVRAADCQGFMGFYSTLPSAGLNELLHRQTGVEVKFYDHEEIEGPLLGSPKGRQLAERYFPAFAKQSRHRPAQLFDEPVSIECENCGKNLLEPPSGVWVLWERAMGTDLDKSEGLGDHFVDMHFACKGKCDRMVSSRVKERHAAMGQIIDGWDDIPDMANPTVYISKIMALLNGFSRGNRYEPEALDKLKTLLLGAFPLVARHLNDKDQELLSRLQKIPAYFGGMGYDF